MRETLDLKAEPRPNTGKGPAYQARQNGFTPAIIYGGKNAAPQPVMVSSRELERHVGTGRFLTSLYNIELEGKKTRVIPRDVQLDPVSDRPVHVDFMRLEEGATITLDIPVHFTGHEVSPGMKRGGTLNIVRHEVELICPADNIPEALEADLSQMDINDSLHISAMALPEGVRPTIARDFTIASIVAPSGMTEPTTAAEGEGEAAAETAAPAAEKK
ncbi:MAG TPA: 50S ribosomal protein L25 [Actinobacteria bacterium]|nr:50S ribosomal protein L25 [Actinomycetota bacterium]